MSHVESTELGYLVVLDEGELPYRARATIGRGGYSKVPHRWAPGDDYDYRTVRVEVSDDCEICGGTDNACRSCDNRWHVASASAFSEVADVAEDMVFRRGAA